MWARVSGVISAPGNLEYPRSLQPAKTGDQLARDETAITRLNGKAAQIKNPLEQVRNRKGTDRCIRIRRIDDHPKPFRLRPQLAVVKMHGSR
jgi:hypothetical protein